MKKNIFKMLLAGSAGIALLSGCGEPLMPNNATQTGAATGAVAGTVIGYNASGHHRGRNAVIGGLLGTAVGAGVGSAIDNQNPEPQETGGWQ
ncbi:glycine zipper domain-containing protein [Sulfurovum sp.]|uniref:YMGG-like glycine zipper-containing protein n=1 Tax=Sulfurovum sp. TaxID=1969726 RepID=UPI0026014194|nr:glycine zipper domain-containing protein [Sulfurovum sp.]